MSGTQRPVDDVQLDALLGEWLSDGATSAPDRIAERAMLEVATTPQEGTRLAAMWASVTQAPLAWAAVILVLAIGLGIVIGPRLVTDEPSPSPSPSASPSAEPSPDGSSVHRSDTPVGTIEWIRTESERRIFPEMEYLGQILGSEFDADFEHLGYWATSDGVAWEPSDGPEFGTRSDYLAGGVVAVVSPDSYGVSMGPISHRQVIFIEWSDEAGDAAIYRQDGSEWLPVAIPDSTPAPVDGLRTYSTMFSGAVELDESNWVAPTLHFTEIPWDEIYGPDISDAWPMWNPDTQLLDIHPENSGPGGATVAELTVGLAGDPQVIEFRDATSGALVHDVPSTRPGWTPAGLLEALRGWGLVDVSFVVSIDGEITSVRAPWDGGEEWHASNRLVTALGRYYTVTMPIAEDYSATAVHLWESSDGLNWTRFDVPQLWEGTLGTATVTGSADSLMLTLSGSQASSLWASADGRSWTQAEVDPSLVGEPQGTDFGWLMNAFDAAAISADGLTWEGIDLPNLPAEPSVSYFDGIFFYGPEFIGPTISATWIGELLD